jgi:hypothetical protein
MSELTLDEAIEHCLEVAEQNETSAITYKNCKEIKTNIYEKRTAEKAENDCRECAAEQRQLAEWLMEAKDLKEENKFLISEFDRLIKERVKERGELLKKLEQIAEYKRLMKAAVDGFKWLEQHTEDDNGGCIVKTSNISCGNCPFNTDGADCKWKHEAEALKLIGDEPNGI